MINTVLFDLDGTLLDSVEDITHALNTVLAEYDQAPVPLERVRLLVADGSRPMLAEGLGLQPEDKEFEIARQKIFRAYRERKHQASRLFPGAADLIQQLQSTNMKWGIVTNKPPELAQSVLDQFNLLASCQVLIGGGTQAANKPSPLPILAACKELIITPQQAVYIGDTLTDVTAATAAGMLSITVSYGYGPPPELLAQCQDTHVIAHLDEVWPWLQQRAVYSKPA